MEEENRRTSVILQTTSALMRAGAFWVFALRVADALSVDKNSRVHFFVSVWELSAVALWFAAKTLIIGHKSSVARVQ